MEELRALVGPDAGGEAIHRVVRLLDRLVGRADRHDREDRAEDLFARNPARLARAREERGREPEALLRDAARCGVALGAFLHTRLDELADPLELHLRVD